MTTIDQEYVVEHLIKFLKEEFERIIVRCGLGSGSSDLGDARALAIWFLHQEVGIPYEDANQWVLDDKNDCGVDFIWKDEDSKRVMVGQVEYDAGSWKKSPASEPKATETFTEFRSYLEKDSLPEKLHDAAKPAWRRAKTLISSGGYTARYYFVTPKHFSVQ